MEIKSDITTEEKCCEFFRDELKRCYREMEQYEKKIEQLENQKIDLVEELAKKTWQDMREQAFRRKQTRRFKG
jgi:t-SNARE complex subunit (syntaxin)